MTLCNHNTKMESDSDDEDGLRISLGDVVTVEGLRGALIVASIWQTSDKKGVVIAKLSGKVEESVVYEDRPTVITSKRGSVHDNRDLQMKFFAFLTWNDQKLEKKVVKKWPGMNPGGRNEFRKNLVVRALLAAKIMTEVEATAVATEIVAKTCEEKLSSLGPPEKKRKRGRPPSLALIPVTPRTTVDEIEPTSADVFEDSDLWFPVVDPLTARSEYFSVKIPHPNKRKSNAASPKLRIKLGDPICAQVQGVQRDSVVFGITCNSLKSDTRIGLLFFEGTPQKPVMGVVQPSAIKGVEPSGESRRQLTEALLCWLASTGQRWRKMIIESWEQKTEGQRKAIRVESVRALIEQTATIKDAQREREELTRAEAKRAQSFEDTADKSIRECAEIQRLVAPLFESRSRACSEALSAEVSPGQFPPIESILENFTSEVDRANRKISQIFRLVSAALL